MTRRAYLYFVLTFLLGAVVGGAGLFYYAWHWGRWHHHRPNQQRIVRHLRRELKLSDAQAQQLTPIVDEWNKKQAELKAQADPQFRALREEFRARVREILNPEQRAKFDDLVRRREERAQKLRGGTK